MAECMEVLNDTALEEQQEEVTVLQSIFQDDFEILQGGDGQANILFNLTVKVNIPFERIDFEAFIPVAVEERSARVSSSESDSDGERGSHQDNNQEGAAIGDSDTLSETQKNGSEVHVSTEDKKKKLPESSPNSTGFLGRRKPSFSRSFSLQHWHVTADLQYLTPIYLACSFPPQYPTECPPELSLSCLWLTKNQIQDLQEKLMDLWKETPYLPIVFTWADWLQNYAYQHLYLEPHLVLKEDGNVVEELQTKMDEAMNGNEDQWLMQNERLSTKLQTALLSIFEYDLEMQRRVFQQSTHLCEICFDERDGTEFHYLDECRHFFCSECLKTHCELHVEGGRVLNLLCPNHNCKSTIPPETLREVLDGEKLERWERLLLSETLDVMGDVVYCPRCNLAVVIDEDETSRLGHCANCYFAFCTECQEPWHHMQPCFEDVSDSDEEENPKSKSSKSEKKNERNVKEEAAAKSIRRQQKLQREKERKKEMSNLSFIRMMKQQGNYQYCPKCRMAVERISGCDMMHCSQCSASFCWRCGHAIRGYEHFGNCGRDFALHQPHPREPTEGERIIERYLEKNPKRKLRTKPCPRCHQKCLKENNNNNHLKCWACKTDFCYQCGKGIKGTVTMHFTAASSCTQHSDD